jgi:hypothetical protein
LMICAVFRTLKAAGVLFRACCLWSRCVNSLSRFVSAILEKGERENESFRVETVRAEHLLFACLCPVSAFSAVVDPLTVWKV